MYRSSPLRSTLNTSYISFGHPSSPLETPFQPPSSPLEAPFNAEGFKPPSSPLQAPLKPSEGEAPFKPPWSPLQAPLKPLEAPFTFGRFQATFKPPWSALEAPFKPPWSLPKVKPPWSPLQAPLKLLEVPSPSEGFKPPWSPLEAPLKPPWSPLQGPPSEGEAPLKPSEGEAPFKPSWRVPSKGASLKVKPPSSLKGALPEGPRNLPGPKMARIGSNGDVCQMFETRLGILVQTLIWKTSKHGQRGAILLGGRELVRGLRGTVSPVSPSLQISLDLCVVWLFVGVALFGWCVYSCWLLLSGKFDFFLHSFQ